MSAAAPVRVYVPSTLDRLRDVVVSGGVGPAPFAAHAVTSRLRAELPGDGEEDLEYVATGRAALACVGLLREQDAPRRVVVALDVAGGLAVVHDADAEDPTLVEVDVVVPARFVAAVLVDDDLAADDVAAAVRAWPAAERDDPAALATLERCLEHELAWYATQEITHLLQL